jgi:hypothetical protein
MQVFQRRLTGRRQAAGLAMTAAVLLAAGAASAGPRSAPASLDGVWTNFSATPLERPTEFKALTTTPAESAAYTAVDHKPVDPVGGTETEWYTAAGGLSRIDGRLRTSIIVDPADGKLPWSAEGRRRIEAGLKNRVTKFDDPETRPGPERCLISGWGANSVPMFPSPDNGGYRFVQTKDALAIWIESGREPRIIRLDAQKHLPGFIRPWMGDSIGHWEGRTLVVETTNFNSGESFKSPLPIYISPEARVTERFTRISKDEILYAFKVEDPTAFATTWQGEEVFRTQTQRLFDFACHEGNYAEAGILAGARAAERAGK